MAKLRRKIRDKAKDGQSEIRNPFGFMADGLGEIEAMGDEMSDADIWEEMPVGIREFIESPRFLNQKWNGRTGCRPYIMEVAENLARDDVREAMLLLGKGSGKDYISSIFHLYGIYKALCMKIPQQYYGLSKGSAIYFVNCARNEQQAKKVFFKEFLGHLDNCPWFHGKYEEPGAMSVRFDKNIEALSANSQAFGWLGYNTIQWVGDELAFFIRKNEADDDEGTDSVAAECWESAYGSCQTRFREHYKMIGITTPRFDDDFVMQKYDELEGRDDGYVCQAATWEVNPNHTIEDYRAALTRNYRRTMRDFGAQPMGVIESFWSDPEYVEENVRSECRECPIYQNRTVSTDVYACWDYADCKVQAYCGNGKWREWLHAKDGVQYFMHFDLSSKKDRLGFALGGIVDHVTIQLDTFELMDEAARRSVSAEDIDSEDRFAERPIIEMVAVGWINPKSKRDDLLTRNGEIYYDGVLRYIVQYLLDRGFDISIISADQFQSHHFRQRCEDLGAEAELLSTDRNDSVPVAAKSAIAEGRVVYPYSRILARETKHLKYIKGNKVDHAKHESKDVWDAVASTISQCETHDDGGGSFIDLGDEEYDYDEF